MEAFEKLEKVGEGTYGKVYKAREKATGKIVALKKIRLVKDEEGVPPTTLRKISLLRMLSRDDPYVVRFSYLNPKFHALLDVKQGQNKEGKTVLYSVFEYMETDLMKFIRSFRQTGDMISPPTIKSLMYQLCKGVAYCHGRGVIHRELLIRSKEQCRLPGVLMSALMTSLFRRSGISGASKIKWLIFTLLVVSCYVLPINCVESMKSRIRVSSFKESDIPTDKHVPRARFLSDSPLFHKPKKQHVSLRALSRNSSPNPTSRGSKSSQPSSTSRRKAGGGRSTLNYRPFRSPAVLVGDGRLGGISATISAYETLKLRGYDVAAVILEDRGLMNDSFLL